MNEQLYIDFENYLNNEMSLSEKTIFEEKLKNDAKLQESFNLYKETSTFLQHKFANETIDFKNNLEKIGTQNFSKAEEKKSKVISFKPVYYFVAASVAIVFGTWFFMQNNNPEFGDYDQHENAMFVERGNIIKNLKQAQDAFNAKNYKEAITNFEIVLKEYKRPEVEFFYGVSLVEENRFQESEIIFNELKNGTSIYKDKATWYLALSSLKQKKYAECKSFINQIPKDAENYTEAQKLLKALD